MAADVSESMCRGTCGAGARTSARSATSRDDPGVGHKPVAESRVKLDGHLRGRVARMAAVAQRDVGDDAAGLRLGDVVDVEEHLGPGLTEIAHPLVDAVVAAVHGVLEHRA